MPSSQGPNVKGSGCMRLWDFLQHLDHHALHMDFNDGCEHIIKVLKTPLVGTEAYIRTARFAVLWRLKNSVEYDSQNRPIFDQVTFCCLNKPILSVVCERLFSIDVVRRVLPDDPWRAFVSGALFDVLFEGCF